MKKLLFSIIAGGLALVANAQEQRVPLYEVFSSSTCPPCNPANAHMKSFLAPKPVEEYVVIKYQVLFPGAGDPYATADNYAKFNQYGFGGVPAMMVNGTQEIYAGSLNQTQYDASKANPAGYKLTGTYTVDGQKVTANINYTPLVAEANPVLMVAIIETETERNAKSNGETKFYHVVKKLVPSLSGTNISSGVLNTESSVSLEFEFKGSYRLPANGQPASNINDATEHSVEDFANLRVVAWIKGDGNTVHQAFNLTEGNLSVNKLPSAIANVNVYPNPTQNDFSVKLNMKDADKVTASLVSVTGQLIKNQEVKLNKGDNTIKFETADVANGTYNLIIFDSKNNSYATQVVVAH